MKHNTTEKILGNSTIKNGTIFVLKSKNKYIAFNWKRPCIIYGDIIDNVE